MNFDFIVFIVVLLLLCVVIFITKRQSSDSNRESCNEDGFLDIKKYPVALTDHARERMTERLGINSKEKMDKLALEAYRFGISANQADEFTADEIRRIESKNENSVVLIYKNCFFIFSKENVLITVYSRD